MSPEPFDSRAEAFPAKRWEKGYGDENETSNNQKLGSAGEDDAFCYWVNKEVYAFKW